MADHFELFERHRETPVSWQKDSDTHATVDRSPPPWSDGHRFGHFELHEQLGWGSSGWVYRVVDTVTKQTNALKILRKGDPETLLRNRHGFRRMASINHRNLARTGRIYLIDGYTALSMQEVRGETFARAIRKIAKMSVPAATELLVTLLRDYATGLAVLHAHGLVHRDIKPHNLMVDSEGRGVIIDFGLVDRYEVVESNFDLDQTFRGVSRFSAPEALWDQKHLPAGDVFSLGAVIAAGSNLVTETLAVDDHEQANGCSPSNDLDPSNAIENLEAAPTPTLPLLKAVCDQMRQRDPGDRLAAMRLARLRLEPQALDPWIRPQRLIGRDREFDQATQWVDGVFDGNVSRLRIVGPSGIGKTRLLNEILDYVESRRWGQAFCGKCRFREDAPLQAFTQICDLIAHRYQCIDREKLELDPVSTAIMCESFPVMEAVIERLDHFEVSQARQPNRDDAFVAVSRIADRLREAGPLFVVIDDVQWADADSLNVLDQLSTVGGEIGLGIITVSRPVEDRQRIPASEIIELDRLSEQESIAMLERGFEHSGLRFGEDCLAKCAQWADGSPFRLTELIEEFTNDPDWVDQSPHGQQDEPATAISIRSLDEFWGRRVGRLSADARRILPLIVVGGQMSIAQLSEMTNLGDGLEAAISELVHARLVVDDADHEEPVSIFHDRVADRLIESLSAEEIHESHVACAKWLIQRNDRQLSARIAGHLSAARRHRQAVHFSIEAAQEAERLIAPSDAARWYEKAAEHSVGEEQIDQIRHAARCYHEAGLPSNAASCFQQIADLVDGEEREHCRKMAVILSIRSGRFAAVRDQLSELAGQLKLPRPKSVWRSKLSLICSVLRLMVQRFQRKNASQSGGELFATFGLGDDQPSPDPSPTTLFRQQQLDFCSEVARPMTMFDTWYATELNLVAARLGPVYGTENQRMLTAVGESVFNCYRPGAARDRGEKTLQALLDYLKDSDNHKAVADVLSGVACSHALASRWNQVRDAFDKSIDLYVNRCDNLGFELAHTYWVGIWSDWNIGRWDHLVETTLEMFKQGFNCADQHMQLLTAGGYGASAWLAMDRADDIRHVLRSIDLPDCSGDPTELFHIFHSMAQLQPSLYDAEFDRAWERFESLETSIRRMPPSRLQLIKVVYHHFGSLTALHQLAQSRSLDWVVTIRHHTRHIRSIGEEYGAIIANLHEGLMDLCLDRFEPNETIRERGAASLQQAMADAMRLGLLPFELAANNAIGWLQQSAENPLVDEMARQGVKKPEKLARLYTIDLHSIR